MTKIMPVEQCGAVRKCMTDPRSYKSYMPRGYTFIEPSSKRVAEFALQKLEEAWKLDQSIHASDVKGSRLMAKEPKTETHLEISVWNVVEGDHIEKIWDGTYDDYDRLVEQYRDDPFYDVVIDREWEEEE